VQATGDIGVPNEDVRDLLQEPSDWGKRLNFTGINVTLVDFLNSHLVEANAQFRPSWVSGHPPSNCQHRKFPPMG